MPEIVTQIGQRLLAGLALVGFILYFFPPLRDWLKTWLIKRLPNPRQRREAEHMGEFAANRGMGKSDRSALNGADFIAAFGADDEPKRSADMVVLRPTLGIRLAMLVVFGVMAGLCFVEYAAPELLAGALPPMPPSAYLALGILVVGCGIIYNGYEVRMNDQVLVVQSSLLSSRDYLWSDLIEFRSQDEQNYRLIFADGRKVNIRKHLTGAELLLARANRALNRNGVAVD